MEIENVFNKIASEGGHNASFALDKEIWGHYHSVGLVKVQTYSIYLTRKPTKDGIFFKSNTNWQQAYNKYRIYKYANDMGKLKEKPNDG